MLIGGRLWIAIAILLGLALIANPRFNTYIAMRFAPRDPVNNVATWKAGTETEVRVTLVTADSTRLACANDNEIAGTHCEYHADGKPWPDTGENGNPNIIQPYRTSPDNQLIFIAGLWAAPALQLRVHREPPVAVAVKRQHRFDAKCRVKFVGQMQDVKLRWDSTARWQTERPTMVARAVDCKVI